MSSVRLMQNVIETRLETRGKGTKESPIRRITQYWDENGNWLADRDDFAPETQNGGDGGR